MQVYLQPDRPNSLPPTGKSDTGTLLVSRVAGCQARATLFRRSKTVAGPQLNLKGGNMLPIPVETIMEIVRSKLLEIQQSQTTIKTPGFKLLVEGDVKVKTKEGKWVKYSIVIRTPPMLEETAVEIWKKNET